MIIVDLLPVGKLADVPVRRLRKSLVQSASDGWTYK
jgi:hypothetical protein